MILSGLVCNSPVGVGGMGFRGHPRAPAWRARGPQLSAALGDSGQRRRFAPSASPATELVVPLLYRVVDGTEAQNASCRCRRRYSSTGSQGKGSCFKASNRWQRCQAHSSHPELPGAGRSVRPRRCGCAGLLASLLRTRETQKQEERTAS